MASALKNSRKGYQETQSLLRTIFKTIRQLHAAGTTILLVEQNARIALQVVNRGYMLQTGVIVLNDTAENLAKNEVVRKTYLGEIRKTGR